MCKAGAAALCWLWPNSTPRTPRCGHKVPAGLLPHWLEAVRTRGCSSVRAFQHWSACAAQHLAPEMSQCATANRCLGAHQRGAYEPMNHHKMVVQGIRDPVDWHQRGKIGPVAVVVEEEKRTEVRTPICVSCGSGACVLRMASAARRSSFAALVGCRQWVRTSHWSGPLLLLPVLAFGILFGLVHPIPVALSDWCSHHSNE